MAVTASSHLVRLRPRNIDEVPDHPAFAQLSANPRPRVRPDLLPFVDSLLKEAVEFTDVYLPVEFKQKGKKSSAPATAQVDLLEHSRVRDEVTETWFARRSVHANTKERGTATLEELDMGLRQDHSRHEMDYTPDVFDAYHVLDWNDQITAAVAQQDAARAGDFSHITMAVYEMCHALPAPLQPRCFSVIVATAKTQAGSFVVVQVPIDISQLDAAYYSNGKNIAQADNALKRKRPVFGLYTSIERCKVTEGGHSEWVMATASDAKGNLPMWAQKMGTPGAVVKDVGLFMDWIAKKRIQ